MYAVGAMLFGSSCYIGCSFTLNTQNSYYVFGRIVLRAFSAFHNNKFWNPYPDNKGPRIDIDYTSIRHFPKIFAI